MTHDKSARVPATTGESQLVPEQATASGLARRYHTRPWMRDRSFRGWLMLVSTLAALAAGVSLNAWVGASALWMLLPFLPSVAFLWHELGFRLRSSLIARRTAQLERPDAENLRGAIGPLASPALRLQASELPILDALEKLELDRAVELALAAPAPRSRRRRGLRPRVNRGGGGELLRAIVAWLAPDQFQGLALARAEDYIFPDRDIDQGKSSAGATRFRELRRWLALLEAVAQGRANQARDHWSQLMLGELRHSRPNLEFLMTAHAATLLPDVREILEDHLARAEAEAEAEGEARPQIRALLERIHPELEIPSASSPFRADDGHALPTRRDQITTEAIELSRLVSHSRRPAAWPVWSVVFIAAGITGVAVPASLAYVCGASLLTALVWDRRRKFLHTQAGTRALCEARSSVDAQWMAELARNSYDDPETGEIVGGLDATDIALALSCIDAEAALSLGRLDDAWQRVAWWFSEAGADQRALSGSRMPMAASLIRIASLCGHATLAAHILIEGESEIPTWVPRQNSKKSALGAAPCAIALARSIQHTKLGDHARAARLMGFTRRAVGRLRLRPEDRRLYAALSRHVHTSVGGVPNKLRKLDAKVEADDAWLHAIWPGLLTAQSPPAQLESPEASAANAPGDRRISSN